MSGDGAERTSPEAARRERLKAALRANLRKRHGQRRATDAGIGNGDAPVTERSGD